jgi:hypothetical protein
LPSGATRSITRGDKSFVGRDVELHLEALVRIERRQIVEVDLVTDLFGIVEIDRVDLQQRKVAFAFLRAPDRPFDGIPGLQREATDLRRGNIDIVGAGEVVGIRRAQKAETILKHFDDAFADNFNILAGKHLQDRKHQFLLAHRAGIFDFERFGERQQIRRGFTLKFLKLHFSHEVTNTLYF